jgi:folate-binding protein YgfZ
MASDSPLGNLHQLQNATFLTIGTDGAQKNPLEIVAVHDAIELEYTALRRRAGLMDRPDRAILRVTGDDRLSFCNNMLTQELQSIPSYGVARSFWLNRKGRIDADFLVVFLDDAILLECHALASQRAHETLTSYVIADDVTIEDISQSTHRLSLHGPTSHERLTQLATDSQGKAIATLAPDHASLITIAGQEILAARQNTLGCAGFELFIPTNAVESVWLTLIGESTEGETPQVRPVGWHAWNIARVESGIPEYLLDFSTDSLPHETSITDDRVSFTKGCYLGQEIVARMQARDAIKQQLVALRCTTTASQTPEGMPMQPVTGEHVRAHDSDDVIGAVTSSVISPLLGDTPICFAMMKRSQATPGTTVNIDAQGITIPAVVQERLASVNTPAH